MCCGGGGLTWQSAGSAASASAHLGGRVLAGRPRSRPRSASAVRRRRVGLASPLRGLGVRVALGEASAESGLGLGQGDVGLLDGLGARLHAALGGLEELLLPVGERLGARPPSRALVALDEALGRGVGDDAGQQRDGADRVVVARDRVLELVRVRVGVEDADHRDAELLGLVDREVLALGVDDPDGARGLGEVADAAERLVELVELALLDQQLLLREALAWCRRSRCRRAPSCGRGAWTPSGSW